ncbi:hypothetical protein FNV43_RR02048 [Rhamnella rubrinervis]|uniref:Uncharacterized protein n=1 Tax=Rhamnella rubrinervis TaxID=2594499 RepID=A0A8K0HRM0_9ROSA|nr:hypothetical protein FNV43_RR02048 [Rhamnella rubrinervis]
MGSLVSQMRNLYKNGGDKLVAENSSTLKVPQKGRFPTKLAEDLAILASNLPSKVQLWPARSLFRQGSYPTTYLKRQAYLISSAWTSHHISTTPPRASLLKHSFTISKVHSNLQGLSYWRHTLPTDGGDAAPTGFQERIFPTYYQRGRSKNSQHK